MLTRRAMVAGAFALPALAGIATAAYARAVEAGDLVGRWKCVDLHRRSGRNRDSAVLGAILVLSEKQRFLWRAKQASRHLPERMSGRWTYNAEDEEMTLKANYLLSAILGLPGDIAIVRFESNQHRLVLGFKSFGAWQLYAPEVYVFAKEEIANANP